MALKRCTGYTSTGDAGIVYDQPAHHLEHDGLLPDGRTNFPPGKSQCRLCYDVYAKDWRARRKVGTSPAATRRTQVAVGTPRPKMVLPDFRAPALAVVHDDDDAEMVSEEDLAVSRSHAYVPSDELLETWGAVTNSMLDGSYPFNLTFLGPSGCGKTEAAQYLAALVGLPFTKIDCAAMTDPESWFGTREVVVEDGASVTSYRPSSFVLAIEQPGVVLLDEVNRVRDEHRNVLLPLMDGTHQVTNPLTGDVVSKHPRCIVIMTGNRGVPFTGTYAIDPALMTRSLTLEFDYAPEAQEKIIAMEATGCDDATADLFVRFAKETRTRALTNPDYSPISTREVIAACKMVRNGASVDTAAKVTVIYQASSEGGSASVRAGLEMIWNGIRAQGSSTTTIAPPCGDEHAWKTDANGNLLRCALPSHHGAPNHKAVNGEEW